MPHTSPILPYRSKILTSHSRHPHPPANCASGKWFSPSFNYDAHRKRGRIFRNSTCLNVSVDSVCLTQSIERGRGFGIGCGSDVNAPFLNLPMCVCVSVPVCACGREHTTHRTYWKRTIRPTYSLHCIQPTDHVRYFESRVGDDIIRMHLYIQVIALWFYIPRSYYSTVSSWFCTIRVNNLNTQDWRLSSGSLMCYLYQHNNARKCIDSK